MSSISLVDTLGFAKFPHSQDAKARITSDLVIAARLLRWTQLTKKPAPVWLAEVIDELGEVIDSGAGDNQDDALLTIIDSLRPRDPK
jgi:hypothetical protein